MIQQDLSKYLGMNLPIIRQYILDQFDKGKSGREIAQKLRMNNKKFCRLLPKLGISNPNPIKLKKKLDERVELRKQGVSICEIAKLQNVSDQAVYSSLKINDPVLSSGSYLNSFNQDSEYLRQRKDKAKLISIKTLLKYRREGFSISAQATNSRSSNTKLWYAYIQKRSIRNNISINRCVGRIKRKDLLVFFPESDILSIERKKTPYIALNSILNNLMGVNKKK